MEISIREETQADYEVVFKLTEEAFRTLAISEHREQFLIERLRKSEAFVPQLSLVACTEDGKVVGHILLTRITIEDGQTIRESLVLAPVSVLPEFQNRGIGGQLIQAAHDKARELGFGSVILVGHEAYYPRFGYELCSKHGIGMPFDAPEINCMVKELRPEGLSGVKGMVRFPSAFQE